MLPLAGSDATIEGYNEWLNSVSNLHVITNKWGFTIRWLSSDWLYYFKEGKTPKEALEAESQRQTNVRLEELLSKSKFLK